VVYGRLGELTDLQESDSSVKIALSYNTSLWMLNMEIDLVGADLL
jgi:hypothetical protein